MAEEDARTWRQLQLLTAKPVLYVCNVEEASAATGNAFSAAVAAMAAAEGSGAVVISAAIEEEVAQLDDAERAEFLEALGLHEAGLDRLIAEGYRLLGLATYFTAGPKEARAWTIPEGASAPQAAGVIHGDFEKGFIRAETVAYDDYVALGGEAGAREAGRLRAEGKAYRVQDGDVLHFLFKLDASRAVSLASDGEWSGRVCSSSRSSHKEAAMHAVVVPEVRSLPRRVPDATTASSGEVGPRHRLGRVHRADDLPHGWPRTEACATSGSTSSPAQNVDIVSANPVVYSEVPHREPRLHRLGPDSSSITRSSGSASARWRASWNGLPGDAQRLLSMSSPRAPARCTATPFDCWRYTTRTPGWRSAPSPSSSSRR